MYPLFVHIIYDIILYYTYAVLHYSSRFLPQVVCHPRSFIVILILKLILTILIATPKSALLLSFPTSGRLPPRVRPWAWRICAGYFPPTVRVYVCMYVYIYIYMFVYVYMYIYIYMYICAYIYIYTYISLSIYIYICVCICMCIYTHKKDDNDNNNNHYYRYHYYYNHNNDNNNINNTNYYYCYYCE